MSHKRVILRIGSIILGIAIILSLIIYSGTSQVLKLFHGVSWQWVFYALLLYCFTWVIRPLFIKLHTNFSFAECFRIINIAYMMNAILPAKAGDFHLIYSIKKKGIDLARSINILVHYRIMDLLSLIIISIPLLLVYLRNNIPEGIIEYLIIVGVIVAIPILMLLDKKGMIKKIFEILEQKISIKLFKSIIGKSKAIYTDYDDLLKTKKFLSFAIALSVWILEGVVSYMMSLSIGYPIPIYIIFLAVSVGNISKVIPVTPGGLGIYEATVILLMGLFGIPPAVATLLSLLDHVLKTLLGVLFGAISLIFVPRV